jgi:hypothetical protein
VIVKCCWLMATNWLAPSRTAECLRGDGVRRGCANYRAPLPTDLAALNRDTWISANSYIGGIVMTVMEFIQGIVLVFCLMATGVVLPIGLVAGSASSANETVSADSGPVFVFEQVQ